MVSITPAEKDAITDGAVVALGTLVASYAGTAVDPHLSVAALPIALIAGSIAAINRYRQDSNLPSA